MKLQHFRSVEVAGLLPPFSGIFKISNVSVGVATQDVRSNGMSQNQLPLPFPRFPCA